MNTVNFFVYGSMSEGLVHFSKISEFVTESCAASIKGVAYRLKVGYPVVLQNGDDDIPGNFVTLNATSLLSGLLDEFHGVSADDEGQGLHFKREVMVNLQNGSQQLAWCYFLNPLKLTGNAEHIEGGDWRKSLEQKQPLPLTLSERQRNYVMRLGASVGREIVPIDLQLYRELMNLEIIVDKGRRLALSKLGHEVFRYLS